MRDMTKAEKIAYATVDEINAIDAKLKGMGFYFLLYTHDWKQEDEPSKNILVTPKDPRFDNMEFYGLLVDMIRDYAVGNGINLCEDKEFGGFIETLKKIHKEGPNINA